MAQIVRSHLTDGRYDYATLKAIDDAEPPIYLAREFRLYCHILVGVERDASNPSLMRVSELPPVRWRRAMDVPVRWMTHAIHDTGERDTLEAVPVPDWLSR